jgi:hypothetical protein
MALSRTSILSHKRKIAEVKIESLGDTVFVTEFIVSERNKLRTHAEDMEFQTLTLILGLCDAHGDALFTHLDVKEIEEMPQNISDELLMAVIDHNQADQVAAVKK